MKNEKEILRRGVKRSAKLTLDGSLRITLKNARYVKFACHSDGIHIEGYNAKPRKGYVVPYEVYGYCKVPKSVVDAYSLDKGTFKLVKMTPTEYYILKKTQDIPHAFRNLLNVDDSDLDKSELNMVEKGRRTQFCMRTDSVLFMGCKYLSRLPIRKITIHTGAALRIDVSYPSDYDMKYYPSAEQVRDEYGSQFQNYCGESLTYIERGNMNRNAVLNIPKPFRVKAGIKKGDSLDVYEGPLVNGRPTYVLAPKTETCAITGAAIDPIDEAPQKAVICNECGEDADGVNTLLDQIASMKKMMQILTEECAAYRKRCDMLTTQITDVTSAFDEEVTA